VTRRGGQASGEQGIKEKADPSPPFATTRTPAYRGQAPPPRRAEADSTGLKIRHYIREVGVSRARKTE